MQRFKRKALLNRSSGEVAEWSIAAVLKTVVLRGTRGSNPCLSAINIENQWIIELIPNFTLNNVELGILFREYTVIGGYGCSIFIRLNVWKWK